MENQSSRTERLIGAQAMSTLNKSSVAVFGIGGVGSYTVEALARAGVGRLCLVDSDTVGITNINRQLIALHSTVGRYKTEVARERILDINPNARVEVKNIFYGTDTAADIDLSAFDYIADAVDTVTAKLLLIEKANACGVSIISCMGAGNKLDPTAFTVADIYKTSGCPLARVMRRELRARGIIGLKTVYSPEPPAAMLYGGEDIPIGKRQLPASISFVPSVAGLIMAGEIIKDLINNSTSKTSH